MRPDKKQMPKPKKGVVMRLLKMLFREYPIQLIAIAVCIAIVSYASTIASIYLADFITLIEKALKGGGWDSIKDNVIKNIIEMLITYALGIVAAFAYTRIGAIMTQDFLNKTRKKMFAKMQELPIKYFDTHPHGDVMSYYTNDIDTLRELISRSIPQFMNSGLIVVLLVVNMIRISVWMTIVVAIGAIVMLFVVKYIGGNSAKYFIKQQRTIAKSEGFVEEMMNGQRVVKAFCHEKQSGKDFDKVNEELCEDATKANRFANILMPIMANIGNILYVLIAFIGGVLIVFEVTNVSISPEYMGKAMDIAFVVPFLGITRQFTNNVSHSGSYRYRWHQTDSEPGYSDSHP